MTKLLYLFFLISTSALAQEDIQNVHGELETIHITDKEIIDPSDITQPAKISRKQLKEQKHTDIMRVLKQVPGVYMREEDGQGLRPNIGMRGTHPDRSKKIVLMEDGILISPAPYSAPAAYYTPSMTTTEGLEIYKGFKSLPWGPNSIGGSINYKTKSFSEKDEVEAEMSYGSFKNLNLNLSNTYKFKNLKVATSFSRLSSNGFKELPNQQNTGFVKNEALIKLGLSLPHQQSVTLKLGVSDETSNESYLGLSFNDFANNPYRRYAASALDKMKWQHQRIQLDHQIALGQNSYIKTSTYMNHFNRTWKRLDRFANGNGPALLEVLNDPTGVNELYYDILTGQENSNSIGSNGELLIASNQREYYSSGVQTQFYHTTKHNDLIIGARFHSDQVERSHPVRRYAMNSGQLNYIGEATPNDVNKHRANAVTFFLQDKVSVGDFGVTFMGRYEDVHFKTDNRLTKEQTRRQDRFFVPGVGLNYNITDQLTLKASINKAMGVAGASEAGDSNNEEAINYEAGFRYQSKTQGFHAESTFFYNDYTNITGVCSGSTGCFQNIGAQFDGGKAAIYGIETGLGFTSYAKGWSFPVLASISFLSATFQNSFESNNPQWVSNGTGKINKGDRLPYIPKIQYSLNVGAKYKKFSSALSFVYQTDMVDQSVEQDQIVIAPYGIVDLTTEYAFSKQGSLFFKVDNLLKKNYTVAARPFGLRPGKPQSFAAGLNYRF